MMKINAIQRERYLPKVSEAISRRWTVGKNRVKKYSEREYVVDDRGIGIPTGRGMRPLESGGLSPEVGCFAVDAVSFQAPPSGASSWWYYRSLYDQGRSPSYRHVL